MLFLFVYVGCGNQIGTESNGLIIQTPSEEPLPKVFAPTDLSGLSVWLDISDDSTLHTNTDCNSEASNSQKISCVQDKSGNANNATASGVDRPTLSGGVLQFNGDASPTNTGNCLDLSSFSGQTIIMVLDNAITSGGGIHGLLGSNSNGQYMFISTNMGYLVSFDGTTSQKGRVAINNNPYNALAANNGSSNLGSSLTLLSAEYENPHSNWENIGCFNHNSGPKTYRANYDLLEIIIFDRVLTDDEHSELKSYLNDKWSIY
jgi:hypothetical protein